MGKDGKTIIPTPTSVLVARIFQLVLSVIVVGGAGWFIHGLYEDSLGFAIVCSLFTWIIFVYALVTEKAPSCHGAYNTWALLALDGVMIVFWLAACGAVAKKRADFSIPVEADCVSDGSAVNSGHCTITSKRAVGVASYAALDVMSAVAGISAIIMLLFVATFAYVCHKFRLSCSSSHSDAEKHVGGTGNTAGVAYHHPGVEMQHGMPQPYAGYPQQQTDAGAAPHQQYYNQNYPYDPHHVR
ncbi:hypothetical protein KJ359_001504 [Pestalotiopsis sp. 9143b]|nr:hypothetical protein KJ359_001504 [Pestalotiopsis sp. 9143b]